MTAGGGAAAAEFFKVGGAGGFFSSVVDVPVNIIDKFQQSMSYENVEVAQIQFFDSGWTFLLCYRDFPTVQTLQKTGEIPQVVFLDTVETPVVVQRQVLGL